MPKIKAPIMNQCVGIPSSFTVVIDSICSADPVDPAVACCTLALSPTTSKFGEGLNKPHEAKSKQEVNINIFINASEKKGNRSSPISL